MGVTDRSYAKTLASDKWDYAAAGYVLDTDQNATDPLDSLSGTFGAQKRGRDGLLNPPNIDHDANTDHHPDN